MIVSFLKRTQHRVHPTGGSLRVFKPFAWLEAGPGKVALSRPAHPQVTHPVSWHFQAKISKGCQNSRHIQDD